jgi:hypothetical protein
MLTNRFDNSGELITKKSSGPSGIYCPTCGHELTENETILLCVLCSTAVPVSNYDLKMFFSPVGCKLVRIDRGIEMNE